jgi:hypothetical protein
MTRRVLAAAATPWMVLATTSLDLYVRNQRELDFHVHLVAPFLAATLVATLVNASLLGLIERGPYARTVVWALLTAGPFVLASMHSRNTVLWFLETQVGTAMLMTAWLVTSWQLARMRDQDGALLMCAAFAAAWIATDVVSFARRYQPAPEGVAFRIPPQRSPGPNIYHFVFDEYDSELFERVLSPDVERALSGFEFYEDAESVARVTTLSVASILTGRRVDGLSDKEAVARLDTELSLVPWLRKAGYATYAYVPSFWQTTLPTFDVVQVHGRDGIMPWSPEHRGLFRALWAATCSPEWMHPHLPRQTVKLINFQGRFMPSSQAAASSLGARQALADERRRPDRGQYVFLHVMFPHPPYILDETCDNHLPEPSDVPVQQAKCANRLMLEWISELKRLGRFEPSLIILQADHGDPTDYSAPVLKPGVTTDDRSLRSLLLVKRAGRGAAGGLQRVDGPVTLLDVAPTILATASATHPLILEGHVLGANAR